jgi:hypothetical protein
MNGSFWNSGGFKDQAKHSVVRDTIVEFRLDFFAVLEIGRDNFSAPFLKNLSGGRDFYLVLPTSAREVWGYFGRFQLSNFKS